MRNLAIITTIVAGVGILAGTANASTEDVTLSAPLVTVARTNAFTATTAYQIPNGDAAIITYKLYRHRSGPGFELVRTVHHVVTMANGMDTATLRTPLWYGVGYRVKVRLVDVSTATIVHAPTVRIHL